MENCMFGNFPLYIYKYKYINPRLSYGSRNKKKNKEMEKEDLVLEDLSWFYVVVDFTDNMIQKQMIK